MPYRRKRNGVPLVDVRTPPLFAEGQHVLSAPLRLVVIQFKAIQVFAEGVESVEQEVMRHALRHRQLHGMVGGRLIRLHQQNLTESGIWAALLYVAR